MNQWAFFDELKAGTVRNVYLFFGPEDFIRRSAMTALQKRLIEIRRRTAFPLQSRRDFARGFLRRNGSRKLFFLFWGKANNFEIGIAHHANVISIFGKMFHPRFHTLVILKEVDERRNRNHAFLSL